MEPESQRYSNVTRALSETPWAILPDTFAAILEAVSLRSRGKGLSDEEIQARIGSGPARRVGYTSGSVAVLPLYGTIFPRANMISEFSGGTSLQQWSAAFDEAVNDPRIDSILIDVHSPGGSTFLVSETAKRIRAARAQKKIVAIANALCCSAAYHLASQANELVAAPSALIGSIGVFMAHEDWSKFDDAVGIKTTLIHAGRYKVEGNEHEPLGEEAKAALQSLVDDIYGLFVADVAAGRGTTPEKVENGYGEGRVLTAARAVAEGMADTVDTFESTLDRLRSGEPAPRRAPRADISAETEPEPEPAKPKDDDQVDDDEIHAEALEGLRALRSDIRGEADGRIAARGLRELADDMRSTTSTGGSAT